jgi:hypothetical protein
MGRRSVEAWRELFEAQARSGMTVREFCGKRGLCTRSFLRRKKELGADVRADARSPFVKVEASETARSEALAPRVRLRLGRCEWELGDLALDDLAHLMVTLA